jgi:hypothetical protein
VVVTGLVVYGQLVTVGAHEEIVMTMVVLTVEVVNKVLLTEVDGVVVGLTSVEEVEETGQIVVYVETVVVVTGLVV